MSLNDGSQRWVYERHHDGDSPRTRRQHSKCFGESLVLIGLNRAIDMYLTSEVADGSQSFPEESPSVKFPEESPSVKLPEDSPSVESNGVSSRGKDADEAIAEFKTPQATGSHPWEENHTETPVDDAPILSARAVVNAGHALTEEQAEGDDPSDPPPEDHHVPPEILPQISANTVRAILSLMGAHEDDILFYNTWSELIWHRAITETADSNKALSLSLEITGMCDGLEQSISSDADLMLQLADDFVRTCEVPSDCLVHLFAAQRHIQAKTLTLWCRIHRLRSGGCTTIDAGFTLDGPIPWTATNKLMLQIAPFDGVRRFTQYSKDEMICTSYSHTLLPDNLEMSFTFSMGSKKAKFEVAPPDEAEPGKQGSLHIHSPLLSAFGHFRKENGFSASYTGYSYASFDTPFLRLESDAIGRIRALTALEPQDQLSPSGEKDLLSPSQEERLTSSEEDTSPSKSSKGSPAKSGRPKDDEDMIKLLSQCRAEDVQLCVAGNVLGLTRLGLHLSDPVEVSAHDLCAELGVPCESEMLRNIQETLQAESVTAVRYMTDHIRSWLAISFGELSSAPWVASTK